MLEFLSTETARLRYLVVPNQREAEVTIRKAIEEEVQLNGNCAFSYSREESIRMLDEALANFSPTPNSSSPEDSASVP